MTDLELDLERARKALTSSERKAEHSHQNCLKKKEELLELLQSHEQAVIQLRKYKVNPNGDLVEIAKEREKLRKAVDTSFQNLKAAIATMVDDIVR